MKKRLGTTNNLEYGASGSERERFDRLVESKSKIWLWYSQQPAELHTLNLKYLNSISKILGLNAHGKDNFLLEEFKKIHPNRDIKDRLESDHYYSGRISFINPYNNYDFTKLNTQGYTSGFGFIDVESEAFINEKKTNIKDLLTNNNLHDIDFLQIENILKEIIPISKPRIVGNIGGFQLDNNINLFLRHNGILGEKVISNLYEIIRRGDHDILHDIALPYYLRHFSKLFDDILLAYQYSEAQTIIDYYRIVQKAFTKNPKLKMDLIHKAKEFFISLKELRFYNYPENGYVIGDKVKHLQVIYLFFLSRIINFSDSGIREIILAIDAKSFNFLHDDTEYDIKLKNSDYVLLAKYLDKKQGELEFIPQGIFTS